MFGLETIEDHYITLNKIPLALQYKLFFKAVKDLLKMQRRFEHLFKNTLNKIFGLCTEMPRKVRPVRGIYCSRIEILNMAHMIEQCILNGNTFSAVGAAHLYGQYGITTCCKRS